MRAFIPSLKKRFVGGRIEPVRGLPTILRQQGINYASQNLAKVFAHLPLSYFNVEFLYSAKAALTIDFRNSLHHSA